MHLPLRLSYLLALLLAPIQGQAYFSMGTGSEVYHYITSVNRSQPALYTLMKPLVGVDFSLLTLSPLTLTSKSNGTAFLGSPMINSTVALGVRITPGIFTIHFALGLGANFVFGNTTSLNYLWEPSFSLGIKRLSLQAGAYVTDAFNPSLKTISPTLMVYWTL